MDWFGLVAEIVFIIVVLVLPALVITFYTLSIVLGVMITVIALLLAPHSRFWTAVKAAMTQDGDSSHIARTYETEFLTYYVGNDDITMPRYAWEEARRRAVSENRPYAKVVYEILTSGMQEQERVRDAANERLCQQVAEEWRRLRLRRKS